MIDIEKIKSDFHAGRAVTAKNIWALIEEVEQLRKELDWYADISNYDISEKSPWRTPEIKLDRGSRARGALKGG